MSDQQQTTLGEPMYVESLMTPSEWQERMIRYPNTSNQYFTRVNRFKTNSFKWRFGMGNTLNPIQISRINSNLDYLRKTFKV
jgi:hypothetical protein